jgi:hypothetical protein
MFSFFIFNKIRRHQAPQEGIYYSTLTLTDRSNRTTNRTSNSNRTRPNIFSNSLTLCYVVLLELTEV